MKKKSRDRGNLVSLLGSDGISLTKSAPTLMPTPTDDPRFGFTKTIKKNRDRGNLTTFLESGEFTNSRTLQQPPTEKLRVKEEMFSPLSEDVHLIKAQGRTLDEIKKIKVYLGSMSTISPQVLTSKLSALSTVDNMSSLENGRDDNVYFCRNGFQLMVEDPVYIKEKDSSRFQKQIEGDMVCSGDDSDKSDGQSDDIVRSDMYGTLAKTTVRTEKSSIRNTYD